MTPVIIIILVVLLALAVFFLVRGLKLIFKKQPLKGLGQLVLSILMLGVMFIVTPQFGVERKGAKDVDAKSNLHNLYLACHAFWEMEGPEKTCTITIASKDDFGFHQSREIILEGGGTKKDFSAKASHKESQNEFSMDSSGNLTGNK